MELNKDLLDLARFLTKIPHTLMNVRLQVALYTNLIAQLHLLTQATYGLRIRLAQAVRKSQGQEASLQGTTTTFAWDARMEALRQSWVIVLTSWPRLTTAQAQSRMV
jgi:hypothetical protein